MCCRLNDKYSFSHRTCCIVQRHNCLRKPFSFPFNEIVSCQMYHRVSFTSALWSLLWTFWLLLRTLRQCQISREALTTIFCKQMVCLFRDKLTWTIHQATIYQSPKHLFKLLLLFVYWRCYKSNNTQGVKSLRAGSNFFRSFISVIIV